MHTVFPAIGIAAIGIYLPQNVETASDIAQQTGIPEHIIIDKFGIRQKYTGGSEDHPSYMATRAAFHALEQANIPPNQIDLIIYHGSEYKDYFVWSAAANIQHALGATNAYAYEIYALCAGAPIALKTARDQMRSDPTLNHVLLVSAARENDLINPDNPNTRFMLNFGAGGSALVLTRESPRNQVLESSCIVDGSFSNHVIMAGGGTRHPTTTDTLHSGMHMLDVYDIETMRDRLGSISLPNFIRVIDEAVLRSNATRSDIDFLIITHMKPSFHHDILRTLGLRPDQSYYLQDYGHIQSVDQHLGLYLAAQQKLINDGDLVVLAGAGTGYTWSATAIRWGVTSV